MKTLLLAVFAVICLAGQAALAQAPLPKPSALLRRAEAPNSLHLSRVEAIAPPSR